MNWDEQLKNIAWGVALGLFMSTGISIGQSRGWFAGELTPEEELILLYPHSVIIGK